jgi:hypothetical protein
MRRRATGKGGDGATFKRYLKVQLLSNPYKFTCQGLLDNTRRECHFQFGRRFAAVAIASSALAICPQVLQAPGGATHGFLVLHF